ncbi:MAG: carbohydrate ABC transporter permease [Gaiellaceae bacterium]
MPAGGLPDAADDSLQPLPEAKHPRLAALRPRRKGPLDVPWLLALPGIAGLALFHFVPIAFGGYYAFTDWDGLTRPTWIGLQNFREILDQRTARAALWNTLELAVCFVIIVNAIGLALALALHRAVKTRHLLRVLFFAPVVLSPLAISYIWRWILEPTGGLDRVLSGVGLESLQPLNGWLGDPSTALWSILVVMVWQYSGLTMVLYLAGLQAISDEVYEATLVDGASGWFRLRKVVLPLLAPALTISATITLIIGMRVFDQVRALTEGGPVDATETLANQVYEQTFPLQRWGYGAAFSLIMTFLIAAAALIQLALLRRNEQRL